MFPEGISDSFELATIIKNVHAKRYPTVQHMATAHGQGDRWAKKVFVTAKKCGILPYDMTPRQWLDLFPVTRRLTWEEQEEQKQRRAKIREAEWAYSIVAPKKQESQPLPPGRSAGGMYWGPEKQFSDLSLDFILSKYKYDDLSADRIRTVKEKLADRQKGVCLICRKPFSTDRKPCLDHCHETGKIRGMLCDRCNLGLGGFQDSILSLENAIKYLLESITLRGTA